MRSMEDGSAKTAPTKEEPHERLDTPSSTGGYREAELSKVKYTGSIHKEEHQKPLGRRHWMGEAINSGGYQRLLGGEALKGQVHQEPLRRRVLEDTAGRHAGH